MLKNFTWNRLPSAEQVEKRCLWSQETVWWGPRWRSSFICVREGRSKKSPAAPATVLSFSTLVQKKVRTQGADHAFKAHIQSPPETVFLAVSSRIRHTGLFPWRQHWPHVSEKVQGPKYNFRNYEPSFQLTHWGKWTQTVSSESEAMLFFEAAIVPSLHPHPVFTSVYANSGLGPEIWFEKRLCPAACLLLLLFGTLSLSWEQAWAYPPEEEGAHEMEMNHPR